MLAHGRNALRLLLSAAARSHRLRPRRDASGFHVFRNVFEPSPWRPSGLTRRFLSSAARHSGTDKHSPKDPTAPRNEGTTESAGTDAGGDALSPKAIEGSDDEMNPGAIGGFMRGLMGGRDVAAEDAFVAEAKQQGIDLPPPPPPRHADLVPTKRRKRRDEESTEEQSIRDRLFSRFAGSPFMQGAFDAKERIAERIDESDNPIVNFFRNIYDRVFAENEMAMVVREIREEDKVFTVSDFLRDAEELIIPKILGAYLAGERFVLQELCTEDAYRMLNASIREREAEGIIMDTNILDISEVELTAGRLLEDAPVLIVTFSAQQINCLRDRSGAVIEGSVDDIRAVYYVWAFVREIDIEESVPSGGGMGATESGPSGDGDSDATATDPESESSDENASDEGTDGESKKAGQRALPAWKMMEMVVRGAHSTI
jgi:predicted lipid-binding transport protein (Tim44 family)